jgi:hypothetical protein
MQVAWLCENHCGNTVCTCSTLRPEVEEHVGGMQGAENTGYSAFDNPEYSPVDFGACSVTQLPTRRQHNQTCDSCCAGPPDSVGKPQITVLNRGLQVVGIEVRVPAPHPCAASRHQCHADDYTCLRQFTFDKPLRMQDGFFGLQ